MNSPCQEIKSLFDQFLDGDLQKRDRARVTEHLKACAACRLELEKEREIIGMLALLPELTCPDHVQRRIEAATIQRDKGESRFREVFFTGESFRWRKSAIGVAVAAIIFVMVILPFSYWQEILEDPYSREDALAARNQAKWTLTYVGQTLNRTEKDVLEDVLWERLPKTLRKSIRTTLELLKGGK
jgi:predicted anti-sigma-YlaC factor YlaD